MCTTASLWLLLTSETDILLGLSENAIASAKAQTNTTLHPAQLQPQRKLVFSLSKTRVHIYFVARSARQRDFRTSCLS